MEKGLFDQGGVRYIDEEDSMSSWEQEALVSRSVEATGDLLSRKKISLPKNVGKPKKINA